jgi:hypothetical protein
MGFVLLQVIRKKEVPSPAGETGSRWWRPPLIRLPPPGYFEPGFHGLLT